MITDLFARCINVILKNEGGYVNNIYDPGGETNFGICKRQYPDIDIKNLTRDRAAEIYFKDYWSKMKLEQIDDEELALQLFDMGVNAGTGTAVKIIQRIVGADVDGVIGPQTARMINESDLNLADLYKQERKKYYFSLARNKPNLQVFIAGWLNRIDHCEFIA
jgi:lysozyme family protein